MKNMAMFTLVLAMAIWGFIEGYTNDYIIVSGKRYEFTKDVVIDTYTLERNKMGNVRVELDPDGKAKEIYFYGIDMPDVIRRFKK